MPVKYLLKYYFNRILFVFYLIFNPNAIHSSRETTALGATGKNLFIFASNTSNTDQQMARTLYFEPRFRFSNHKVAK